MCRTTYNVCRKMIGIHRLVVWTLVLRVSTPTFIRKSKYNNWLTRHDVTNETSLSNEIQSKTITDNNEDASTLYIPEISEQCERLGICENVPNYPDDFVKSLLLEARWLGPTRFDTNVNFYKPPQRDWQFKDYEELCTSEKKIIMPMAAKDINNEWHFIVNPKENPTQTFQVEICKNQNSSCKDVVTFASNYKGWCEQKYIFRIMKAINKYGQVIEEPYQLLSCCSCVYK